MWEEESLDNVPVWLDSTGPITVPPAAGVMRLRVGYRGRELGATPAMNIAGQWDWTEITDRVVHELQWPVQMGILLSDRTDPAPRRRPDNR